MLILKRGAGKCVYGRWPRPGFSTLKVPHMVLVAIVPNPQVSKELILHVWLIKSVSAKLALGI